MEKRDYSRFKDIGIFDTGLIKRTKNIEQYFTETGISSLADLFARDDDGLLNLPTTRPTFDYLKRLIKLSRYKYLHEDLVLSIDPNKRHKKEEVFDIDSRTIRLSDSYDRFYNDFDYGIKLGNILSYAYPILGDEFSLTEIFTNPAIISKFRNLSKSDTTSKNCFLVVCDYMRECRERKEQVDTTSDLRVLDEEEGKLLSELLALTERSSAIAKRISEIKSLKEGMSKGGK